MPEQQTEYPLPTRLALWLVEQRCLHSTAVSGSSVSSTISRSEAVLLLQGGSILRMLLQQGLGKGRSFAPQFVRTANAKLYNWTCISAVLADELHMEYDDTSRQLWLCGDWSEVAKMLGELPVALRSFREHIKAMQRQPEPQPQPQPQPCARQIGRNLPKRAPLRRPTRLQPLPVGAPPLYNTVADNPQVAALMSQPALAELPSRPLLDPINMQVAQVAALVLQQQQLYSHLVQQQQAMQYCTAQMWHQQIQQAQQAMYQCSPCISQSAQQRLPSNPANSFLERQNQFEKLSIATSSDGHGFGHRSASTSSSLRGSSELRLCSPRCVASAPVSTDDPRSQVGQVPPVNGGGTLHTPRWRLTDAVQEEIKRCILNWLKYCVTLKRQYFTMWRIHALEKILGCQQTRVLSAPQAAADLIRDEAFSDNRGANPFAGLLEAVRQQFSDWLSEQSRLRQQYYSQWRRWVRVHQKAVSQLKAEELRMANEAYWEQRNAMHTLTPQQKLLAIVTLQMHAVVNVRKRYFCIWLYRLKQRKEYIAKTLQHPLPLTLMRSVDQLRDLKPRNSTVPTSHVECPCCGAKGIRSDKVWCPSCGEVLPNREDPVYNITIVSRYNVLGNKSKDLKLMQCFARYAVSSHAAFVLRYKHESELFAAHATGAMRCRVSLIVLRVAFRLQRNRIASFWKRHREDRPSGCCARCEPLFQSFGDTFSTGFAPTCAERFRKLVCSDPCWHVLEAAAVEAKRRRRVRHHASFWVAFYTGKLVGFRSVVGATARPSVANSVFHRLCVDSLPRLVCRRCDAVVELWLHRLLCVGKARVCCRLATADPVSVTCGVKEASDALGRDRHVAWLCNACVPSRTLMDLCERVCVAHVGLTVSLWVRALISLRSRLSVKKRDQPQNSDPNLQPQAPTTSSQEESQRV